jgi:DNA-binding transcriptional LysR family regulator
MSFTKPAGELGVSQAAVSRQIQALERHTGRTMFRRLHRALRLTPEGEQLQAAVTMGLRHIAETAQSLRRVAAGAQVTVSATIAFAALWLMPRIDRFYAAYPDLELRLIASDTPIDLRTENVDIAVFYGDGRWPGLETMALFDEEIFPVCSPDYLAARPGLSGVSDLLTLNLLQQEAAESSWLSWERWFRRMGVVPAGNLPGPRFNNYTIVVQAAQAGQGVALGWRRLLEKQLETGSLVRPIAASLPAEHSYYVATPHGAERTPEASAFHDWLLIEAGGDP